MWRVCIWGLCIFCACTALAGNHYISHIAGANWTTTITAYNDGHTDRTCTLYRYAPDGTETAYPDLLVPAGDALVLTSADFGFDGAAILETPETESPLSVKLAYRYQDSHSLCEFFIPDGAQGTNWMLPNPFQSHFDWFGMAIANHGDTAATLTLTAWKNGAVVDTHVFDLSAKHKVVDVADGFWSGMDYAEVDLVTMESTLPIAAPISITGNDDQDRHVFFLGQEEVVTDPPAMHTYNIPHIAAANWTTRLTVFNNTGDAASIFLSTWTPEGDPDLVDAVYPVPANGTLELEAGTDFVYGGIGDIRTEDDIQVKLTYRYQSSESLCEFFLSEAESTQWFIPNSIHDWFDWYGLALCNPTSEPVAIALDAYKDGVLVEIGSHLVQPKTKIVGLADTLWPDMSKMKAGYDSVDMVVIRANAKIPTPLSITGNTEQDRHVFFLSSKDTVDPDFPDPAFKAFLLANFDSNHDGMIDASEAAAVTNMDTPGQYSTPGNIRDITGIEIFVNLVYLEASSEQLSWIPDLSAIPNLQSIKFGRNQLVAIEDWSSLTSLNYIEVGMNMLTELPPMASLVNLQWLYAGQNRLNSLPDMTGLNLVSMLDLYNNNLSEIIGIEGMSQLYYLSIGNNNFDVLPDISAATASLFTLYCSNNNISSIPDLTPYGSLSYLSIRNNNIGSVTGLPTLTQMQMLDVSENPISTLGDLSGLDSLYQFDVDATDIAVIEGLGDMDSLTMFYCSDTLITDLTPLNGKTDFLRLMCNNCPGMTPPDFTGWTSLQRFGCRGCELDDIPDVTDCTAMYYYDCAGNNFGQDDCPLIQAIEAMGMSGFFYNPQADMSTLICD